MDSKLGHSNKPIISVLPFTDKGTGMQRGSVKYTMSQSLLVELGCEFMLVHSRFPTCNKLSVQRNTTSCYLPICWNTNIGYIFWYIKDMEPTERTSNDHKQWQLLFCVFWLPFLTPLAPKCSQENHPHGSVTDLTCCPLAGSCGKIWWTCRDRCKSWHFQNLKR